jgi:hypothetical protein
MDFRLFLLRHWELLRPLVGWTIRVLVPEPFTKAIRMFGHAAREELATPIAPATAEGLERFFRERQQRQQGPSQLPDERFQSASLAYRARASEPSSGCGSRRAIRRSGPRSLGS